MEKPPTYTDTHSKLPLILFMSPLTHNLLDTKESVEAGVNDAAHKGRHPEVPEGLNTKNRREHNRLLFPSVVRHSGALFK